MSAIMNHELKKVEVRLKLVEGGGLYSEQPLSDAESAVRVMADAMAGLDRENVCIVNMDAAQRPINFHVVSIGDINSAYVPLSNVFKAALLSNAAGIMLLHNHPSSVLKMSQQDREVTQKVIAACQFMGIPLIDHIIVAGGTGECFSIWEHMPELWEIPDYKKMMGIAADSVDKVMEPDMPDKWVKRLYRVLGTEKADQKIIMDFKHDTEKYFRKIDGMDAAEIEQLVREYTETKVDEWGVDAELVDLAVGGSRCRGTEHVGSDLDIVFEYRGSIREDALFNILQEDSLQIGGVLVDFNPITEGKTGTLADYLCRAEEYLDRELAFRIEDRYFLIHKREEGYDYSILDEDYHELEGGIYDSLELPIRETLSVILDDMVENEPVSIKGQVTKESKLVPLNYEETERKMEMAEQMRFQKQKAEHHKILR